MPPIVFWKCSTMGVYLCTTFPTPQDFPGASYPQLAILGPCVLGGDSVCP